MPIKYDAPEILEMAVRTEQGGRKFYRTVAERTEDPDTKAVFLHLEQEEERHIATFRDIARNLREKPEQLHYNWEEETPYLQAIVGSRYFLDDERAERLARTTETPRDAVEHALGFERQTLLFYTELRGMVDENNRAAVERLITEEKSHVVKLTALLGTLAGQ